MLERLTIKDLALIDGLEVALAPGLNLITGETGSGKSILLDALGFVLGSRASVELIRAQAEAVQVGAEFSPSKAWARQWKPWFDDKGLPWEDGQLLLKRELNRSGKGRAWINGEAAPVGLLAELGQGLVDFHGQHDHQSLLRTAEHRGTLDRFGALDAEAAAVAAAWDLVQERKRALEGPSGDPASRRRQLEFLDFQVRELDELSPKEGEFEGLRAAATLQATTGKRAEALGQAESALNADEGGALPLAGQALSALRRAAELDPRQKVLVEQLERGLLELRDVADGLRAALEAVELDPAELERLQQRLHAWEKLSRKHQCEPDGLPQAWARLRKEQESLRFLLEDEAGLSEALEKAGQAYAAAALALSRAREKAAARLIKVLTAELQQLVNPNALFTVRLQRRVDAEGPFTVEGKPCKGDKAGIDDVEFLFAPNLGEGPKPLARIASGGELSRVALALKTVFARQEGAPSLVFDEIDSGVSGRMAALVGAKIAALAQRHQVLCITHLPQIASLEARHLKVSKHSDKGQTHVKLVELDDAGRQMEVASLIDGAEAGASALAHAKELLGRPGGKAA